MMCKNCKQERRGLNPEGVCIICLRASRNAVEVKTTKFKVTGTTEVFNKTGKLDENMYLRG